MFPLSFFYLVSTKSKEDLSENTVVVSTRSSELMLVNHGHIGWMKFSLNSLELNAHDTRDGASNICFNNASANLKTCSLL